MKKYRAVGLFIVVAISIFSLLSLRILSKNYLKSGNKGILSFATFKGCLYAGTWNDDRGCQLWRTDTGTKWVPVTTRGFDDSENVELLVLYAFNGYLYAGGRNYQSGAHLYRSLNGRTWEAVVTDGFGEAENIDIASLCQFKGQLYAGTRNNAGAQLWKSHDGKAWRRVDIDGLVNADNIEVIYWLFAHDGCLYLGPKADNTALYIYRSQNGTDWKKVDISTNFFNAYNCIIAFRNYVYAAAKTDINEGCGGIISTGDGKNWVEVENLPNKNQLRVDCLAVFDDELYGGVRHLSESGKLRPALWKSNNGFNWVEVDSQMCADPNNTLIDCLIGFNGYLYAGMWNDRGDAQIWRTKDSEVGERVF